MNKPYTIRPAVAADISKLLEAILHSEKAGTNKLSYATLADISESEAQECLAKMLSVAKGAGEFNLENILIAEIDGEYMGSTAAWLEGSAGQSSAMLRAILIHLHFSKPAKLALLNNQAVVADFQYERKMNCLQIEHVYVAPEHRKQGVAKALIEAQIQKWKNLQPNFSCAQVYTTAAHLGADKLYEQLGFTQISTTVSTHPELLNFLPSKEHLLFEKQINQ